MSPTVAPKTPQVTRRPKALDAAVWRARWQDPKFRWFALGTAAVLLVSTVGAALFFAPRADGSTYMEIYVTDFPGDFERFQLNVAGVYVGDAAYELQLDVSEFDILQYRGTGNSLLLAYGDVPGNDHDKVSVVFTRAQAYFAGQWIPIPIPHKMLTINDGFDLAADRDGALLLDFEMEESLVLTEKGYTFEPYVKNLYEHEFPKDPSSPNAPPTRGSLARNGFTDPPTVDPGQQREDEPPARSTQSPTSSSAAPSPSCTEDCEDGNGGNSTGGDENEDDSTVFDRTLPSLPTGELNDPNSCPSGEFENPDVAADPAKWAERALMREACDLQKLTETLYAPDGPLTYIGKLVEGHPIYVPKDQIIKGSGGQSVSYYQGAPDVDVNALLDNLPDLQVVLDPITGSVLPADAIQDAASEIAKFGGQPLFAYSMAPAIAFQAMPDQAWAISQSDVFEWVELADEGADIRINTLASANANTQLTPLRTYASPNGLAYDGHGIGVAIIDTGVDGLHRDLPYDAAGVRPESAALLENCVINPPKNTYGVGAVPLLDQSSLCVRGESTDARGHGTMVAGVAIGRPPAQDAQTATLLWGASQVGISYESDGIYSPSDWLYGDNDTVLNAGQSGVAPAAKGFAISFAGDGANILMATLAYDRLLYMLDHPIPGDPRILVVTNSWETSWSSTDENSLLYWQINEIVNRGVTVVFSAGNSGGDGITPMTSPECVHPREGVVCVGAVEDNNRIDRNMSNVWYASSRGARFEPVTWPDLCAPGTRLRTTYATPLSPNSIGGFAAGGGITNPYALFTGTSASAPYVAGVVAILQQTRHDAGLSYLAPEQVEWVLEQGAYPFPNVSGGYAVSNDARYHESNYECGHGLVDAMRAVELALSLP